MKLESIHELYMSILSIVEGHKYNVSPYENQEEMLKDIRAHYKELYKLISESENKEKLVSNLYDFYQSLLEII